MSTNENSSAIYVARGASHFFIQNIVSTTIPITVYVQARLQQQKTRRKAFLKDGVKLHGNTYISSYGNTIRDTYG